MDRGIDHGSMGQQRWRDERKEGRKDEEVSKKLKMRAVPVEQQTYTLSLRQLRPW